MTSLVLRLEYEGTDFHGFAESRGVRTVAGELRRLTAQVTQTEEIELRGASRTDTGVHAFDQCVRIDVASAIGVEALGKALTAMVPEDIRIRRAIATPPDFDPSRSALEKRYLYRIRNTPSAPPLSRRFEWAIRTPLDLAAMQRAARPLVGTHDFAAYRNRSKGEPENTVRTVRAIDLRAWDRENGDREIAMQVIGSGFLYRMVRNLVGTLVEVGRGSMPEGQPEQALRGRDRGLGGPSAPPQGLFLAEIQYPGEPDCAMTDSVPHF